MNYALIFAGGVGSRMHSKAKPKQFLEIHGKPIIIHTLEHFENHQEIDAICVVCVADWVEYLKKLLINYGIKKVRWIIEGGETALDSQYKGLVEISRNVHLSDEDIVLIHDGVRPLIDEDVINACIKTTMEHGSAVIVAPAIETIIKSDDSNRIISTIPRSECLLARAPQTFYLKQILTVHSYAIQKGKHDFVDSTSMMLHYGYEIYTVEGPSENIKVTNPADFYICQALLDAKENMQIYGI